MSDKFKRYMTFTKSERIAILSIVAIIVIILICKYLLIKKPPKRTAYFHNLDSIVASRQAEIDSLLELDSINKVERRKSFSKKNEKKTKRDFKYKNEAKYDRKNSSNRNDSIVNQSFEKEKTIQIIDLNKADTTRFKTLPGIGSSFAKRIVEYREKLGGFVETEQLLEVYGMDSTRYENIENYITVDSIINVKLLSINYDSFKVLNRHPYLQYDDVKKIVNYREQKGLITTWEQLEKVVGKELEPRLQKYIKFEE